MRRELWKIGLRYRVDVAELPGRPDVVFSRARVVVFCDGDFWHGRDLDDRLGKLARGRNAPYWVAKIIANVARDRRHDDALGKAGWLVLRFWTNAINVDRGNVRAYLDAAKRRIRRVSTWREWAVVGAAAIRQPAVLTDIMGPSGRAILQAMITGPRTRR